MLSTMKVIFKIVILWCCYLNKLTGSSAPYLYRTMDPLSERECLTGYMTDVQNWVLADGSLNLEFVDRKSSVDLSQNQNPSTILHQILSSMRTSNMNIKYLSMARCALTRIPLVFQTRDYKGRYISETLEYMSFYGNQFVCTSSAGKEYDALLNATGAVEAALASSAGDYETTLVWSAGLEEAKFPRLKELDLRACSIRILSPSLFQGMENLEALYIGENKIHYVKAQTFSGLKNLRHLDFSRNHPEDENNNAIALISESLFALENLTNLVSLEMSHTKLNPRSFGIIRGLGKKLKSLSICNTGLANIIIDSFKDTSLEILDLSRNNRILSGPNGLIGLEDNLVVLYARDTGIQSLDIFKNFRKLEILQISNNEITSIDHDVAKTLPSLQILDMNNNRLGSWFEATFALMPRLRFLSVKENNINVITENMINDLMRIDHIALTGNSFVCNCHAKDFYKMAAINEEKFDDTRIKSTRTHLFHTGLDHYNEIIRNRIPLVNSCEEEESCEDFNDTGRFRLLDAWEGSYTCLNLSLPVGIGSKSVAISSITGCSMTPKILEFDPELKAGKKMLFMLLIIPCILVPMLFLFLFRRNLKYCIIMMRNTAMLSLINKNEVIEDGTIFNYDVFVSYCNEDRAWVLDHLLPHMESECSVSACLHERDFQVGLSILENIVSCMDRSRLIMLIISQRFLLSQWCQFEMHLAQHRLLETRREDLILVLLEDIPRRLRPNTLHYLMLTKTYIVWPKSKSDRIIFWKRIKKSLLSQKTKVTENVSLA